MNQIMWFNTNWIAPWPGIEIGSFDGEQDVLWCGFGRAHFEALRDATPIHDQDRITHAQQLTHLAGDDENGHPLRSQLAHNPVDIHLGVDIYALRRLMQDEHVRIGSGELGEDDLLLIAAA
jgi:hypothetical protein